MRPIKLALLPALPLLIWAGCGHGSQRTVDIQSRRIDQLILAHRSDLDLDSLSAVLVITEEGCIPCSRAFSEMIADHLSDPGILFWVSATGTGIDINNFKAHPDHVVWDYDHALQRSGLLEGTGAILLKNGKVDTIIPIDARHIEATLAYLQGLFPAILTSPQSH